MYKSIKKRFFNARLREWNRTGMQWAIFSFPSRSLKMKKYSEVLLTAEWCSHFLNGLLFQDPILERYKEKCFKDNVNNVTKFCWNRFYQTPCSTISRSNWFRPCPIPRRWILLHQRILENDVSVSSFLPSDIRVLPRHRLPQSLRLHFQGIPECFVAVSVSLSSALQQLCLLTELL